MWGELFAVFHFFFYNMRATGKYAVQLFNVAQHFWGFGSVEQRQNEIPLVFTRMIVHPEICIHGCKCKWNKQRGVSCSASTSYWGAVEGIEWHLTVWGWAASDRLECSRWPGTYRNSVTVLPVFRGAERNGPQDWGSYFSKPPPCRSQGRQTGKSILPLRTVHFKGLPQRHCLSESVPQAGWDGTADKVGVRAHWSHC